MAKSSFAHVSSSFNAVNNMTVCYDRLHAYYYQDLVSLITLYLEFGSSGLYKLEHLFLRQFAECLGLGHFLEVLCNVFMTQHPNISYLHACVKVHWKGQSERYKLVNYTIGER